MFTFLIAKVPEFTKLLDNAIAVEGKSAKMSVKVEGFPKPEITWYLDDLPVRNDIQHHIVEEDNTIVLHISSVVIDDEGVYTVKAVNTLGSSQCQAEFLVECKCITFRKFSDISNSCKIHILVARNASH